MDTISENRLRAVRTYLEGGTLRATASLYGVHLITLWQWVKWYRESGEAGLTRGYRRPWNRAARRIEEQVMNLKENNPALTVSKAGAILRQKSIVISANGIHGIWKRFNLVRRGTDDPLSPRGPLTPEAASIIETAQKLINREKDQRTLRRAAQMLNDLPCFPPGYDDVLKRIPEKYLSSRRKLDRRYVDLFRISMPGYVSSMRRVRKLLEKEGLLYSSIVAGLAEINAMNWMHIPEEELKLNTLLERRKGTLRDPVLNFVMTFLRGKANALLLRTRHARQCARKCRKLLVALPGSGFLLRLGDLYSTMGDYKKAAGYFQRALEIKPDELTRKHLLGRIALCYVIMGEYRKASKIFTKTIRIGREDRFYDLFAILQAFSSFKSGKLEKARYFLHRVLERSEREQLRNYIFVTSSCLAAIDRARERTTASQRILGRCLPVMKKYGLKKEALSIKLILGAKVPDSISSGIPMLQLLTLLDRARRTLRETDYQKALAYSKKNRIVGYLHRMIVFFPEPVRHLLSKGRRTDLPKALLKMPIFNKEIPVYHVKLLGNLTVSKNGQHLPVKLSPKDRAFLIHLALRLGEPGTRIMLDDLYGNFWSETSRKARNLSHMLVRVRTALQIPAHLLEISPKKGNAVLINRGLHFTTDYGDFDQSLVTAHAFTRASEPAFAEREYRQAFQQMRGTPFRKMFDPWSEELRRSILGRFEKGTIAVAESYLRHNARGAAKRVLEKALRIMPNSEEVLQMLKNL